MSGADGHEGQPALVVFVDRAECRWLRLLKPGFRHCFAVLRDGPAWLVCDPLLDRIELHWLDLPPEHDLARHYAAQGHIVLAGRAGREGPTRAPARLAPLTCVTVVKRIIGLCAPRVMTPWQLFRHLARRRERPFAPVVPTHAGHGRRCRFVLDSEGIIG